MRMAPSACVTLLGLLVVSPPPLRPGAAIEPAPAGVSVDHLTIEYQTNPLGLGTTAPRLTWRLRGDRRGVSQAGYQVRVARSPADLEAGRNLAWDSGRVRSNASVHVPYGGEPLQSRQRYHWKVRVWDDAGVESPWSEPAWWEMGLLGPADWAARWIRARPPRGRDGTDTGAVRPSRVPTRRTGAHGAGLRDESRTLRASSEREAGERGRADTRLDQLRDAAPVSDLRRDRSRSGPTRTSSPPCWVAVVPVAKSDSLSTETTTATVWRSWPSSTSSTPTDPVSRSRPMRSGNRPRARFCRPRFTTARSTTPVSRTRDGIRRGSTTRGGPELGLPNTPSTT